MTNFEHLESRASWAPAATPRRRIGPDDIAFAKARRERGQGWQTIASQLRCNAADLKRVVEDGDMLVVATTAPALRSLRIDIKPCSALARILIAISTGAKSAAAVALEAGSTGETVRSYLPKLKADGLIGERNDGEGWPMTAAGLQAVRALKRAQAEAEAGHG